MFAMLTGAGLEEEFYGGLAEVAHIIVNTTRHSG